VNVKRGHWLYRLEGLQMRLKPPRRRVMANCAMTVAMRLASTRSGRWTGRMMSYSMGGGCGFPPSWTPGAACAPVMRVCRSATAMEVIDALDQARRQYGLPTTIRVDQGSQFTSKELDLWTYANGITNGGVDALHMCIVGRLSWANERPAIVRKDHLYGFLAMTYPVIVNCQILSWW
jgi:putative transposase